MWFIFRFIGSVVLTCEYLFFVSGELKCSEHQYKDGATNICMPCNACCPPRPQNQYCKKGCDLDDVCKVLGNPNPNSHWPILAIAIPTLILVGIVIVVVIYRRRIGKVLRRLRSKRKGVQDTNPDDPRQCQVIGGHEVDSTTPMNGPSVQAEPPIDNIPAAGEAFRKNPTFDNFRSIPANHFQTQNCISVPYSSLPIPQYLEKYGTRFIRQDIISPIYQNIPLFVDDAQLQARLNYEENDEATGFSPSVPLHDRSPRSTGPGSTNPEDRHSRITFTGVQCTEDLDGDYETEEIFQDETPVKM